MAASLIGTSARTALRSGASATQRAAGVAGLTFARGKATLPDLPYDFGALEPSISGKIMELHYKNHHQTYVNSYNQASEQLQEARAKGDIAAQIALQPLINFHGGGHLNHSLFWENLAPKSSGGGEPPSGALSKAINETYGGLENLQGKINTALAGIQGSGWAWLVRDKQTGDISIKTYANQDPVVGQFEPLLGIDAWEHAYYLQYQNRKAEYFKAIWEVINWKTVEKRFSA
ncbi:superoxide dismutase sodB [Aspergillus clavatus NRRL 1]|uniref:Superoxide dismutase n=1 Tax=Aspergillus clavatus (strain ATCC 1007 / CBS 513.65 / DSM 816 / NCTC 3887 / NRRL 1 / QM 1276 / 107) TaxID=344612 RepID=A1CI89_ASPCL|nr:Mn superoxide dismutase (SodB), putative [Aspergillus clavatus NRRL 1]EAW10594.1 Mn superoxide dismutase (SodB), putative [Aspergillus clavatus NRRL 1]